MMLLLFFDRGIRTGRSETKLLHQKQLQESVRQNEQAQF
jgi:hypothetical protein